MSGISDGSGAAARAFAATARFSPARALAWRALKLMVISVTAALFAFFLAAQNARRIASSGLSPAAGCESLGRGGTYCADPAGEDRRRPDPAIACLSLGRGGLICPETARK